MHDVEYLSLLGLENWAQFAISENLRVLGCDRRSGMVSALLSGPYSIDLDNEHFGELHVRKAFVRALDMILAPSVHLFV